MAQSAEEYLTAFANGMEFVLLGVEGRIAGEEGRLDPETARALLSFLGDYRRIAEVHRGPSGSPRLRVRALEVVPAGVTN
ncbi:MAG TPA: hypothetical protein VM889_09290 [Candidatus Thermoplasmatota archaeon]|nr:hypothetical protein [Candidatus Thermoplasmatota archaeon]